MVNFGDLLRRRAWITPNNNALVDLASGERLSYLELNKRANTIANGFLALGIGAGDRVALLCMNCVELVECYYGAAKIGAVVVPLNWRLTAPELTFILNDSGTKVLIFGSEFFDLTDQVRKAGADATEIAHFVEIGRDTDDKLFRAYEKVFDRQQTSEPEINSGGDDPLTIAYTSGTTGLPKGVVHSHRTANAGVINVLSTIDIGATDIYLVALPLFHVGASTPLLSCLYCGATVLLMRQFDPAAMWEIIEREKVTATLAVPAMLNFMLKVPGFRDRDLSSLVGILSGASPVPAALIDVYHAMNIDIHQVYGMTETFGPGCYLGGEDAVKRAGSAGRGYLLTDVRIVDEKGHDVPADTPGQILLCGEHNMVGYWNNPEATAETIVDGWLHTGDIGIADADGFVTVHDRLKDMIISGGENVYPAEVENALLGHPDVSDVAVIGQPSEAWGEVPFAVVVRANENTPPEDILKHCQGSLARYKQPKGIAFVDEIPRNPTGKPLKRILRDQFPVPAIE